MDNLSAHQGATSAAGREGTRSSCALRPTYASWPNPIEAYFGALRQFTIANSSHPNHTVQTKACTVWLGWPNTNARHRDVLAAARNALASAAGKASAEADAPHRGLTNPANQRGHSTSRFEATGWLLTSPNCHIVELFSTQ
ncbi:hypothetical protein [Streptomyces collinus]|uniref:hypothetical protein n=1 Tax=Streptomyces collinus TaxID=42684 RepID=UPI0036BBD812